MARIKYTEEDQKTIDQFKRMRETFRMHHPQDDCPYGAPFGGYTVSDTRRAMTARKKAIDAKYKSDE